MGTLCFLVVSSWAVRDVENKLFRFERSTTRIVICPLTIPACACMCGVIGHASATSPSLLALLVAPYKLDV